MKEINFRIIELPTHQILISKDFDDEEESELLVMTFFIEGVKVTQKFGYDNEEKRNEMFDKITDEQAQKSLDGTIKMFTEQ
jgi:hypothetical protein